MAQGVKANLDKEELSHLLKEHTIKEVAEILNVSTTTIKRYKTKYNIPTNLQIAKQRNSEAHTVYSCDIKYFNNIDTLDKAYLLGFICADGFVTDRNEIGIGVAKKDKSVVEFFQSQLKSNKPIQEGENQGNGYFELRVQNNILAEKLQEYGVIPNKSLVLNIEDVIKKAKLNEKQISVFLLGYFDGDGCISIAHNRKTNKEYFEMNVTGTLQTILYYQKYFDSHGSITKRHDDNKNNYTLQMSNNYSTIYNALFKLYQYKDELSFYFQRKYILFEQLETKVKS